ncbi:sn-glycerol-1-phosphate dehydrogenase [Pelagibius litoralis]|uniref:Sn-glycerol-1-phosphate dehydrogenase n=1 Tax=Pelagibius litoralis TaxID=374515 RepID=A0A967EZC5_9PROT|nr:sn-glycerol-1-phosphate dehydrogenase [Pelagibius litoralis]NIA70187.1 sn-glycerol-1-phosphate dehydrogenase [Pelagibius litoralis]
MSDWRRQLEDIVVPAVARSQHIVEILVDSAALDRSAEVFRRHFGPAPAFLVADSNTFAAAGETVLARLAADGIATETLVLPAEPRLKPTRELAEEVGRRWLAAPAGSVPVAVGSGVLNDLVKYAAFVEGRPFFCVATAASMDGYASAGAPLVDCGFKHTIACAPPRAILADLDVIAAAPAEMTGWGYGDLAGKVPAGGDWILADALGIEPLDDVAWPLVQDRLRAWLAEPAALRRGDAAAMAGLFAGLTVTGLAMEFHGSSRPASGADHQIAHLWEMENLSHNGVPVSHGACVSIGSLTVLALFDWLLAQDLTSLDKEKIIAEAPGFDETQAAIHRAFPNDAVAGRAVVESKAKHLSPAAHAERLALIAETWPALRRRLGAHLLRAGDLRDLLAAAGAPTLAAEIGLSPDHHKATLDRARFLRSRYTVLDFLSEVGLLGVATAAIFQHGGLMRP